MNTYYVSLTSPLLGNYIEVRAKNELAARLMLNNSKLAKLWGGISHLKEGIGVERYSLNLVKADSESMRTDSAEEAYKKMTGGEL